MNSAALVVARALLPAASGLIPTLGLGFRPCYDNEQALEGKDDVAFSGSSELNGSMLKHNLASFFREEITNGKLKPGDRIVEVKWAAKLGVAQASIREALNILASEGFIEKGSGRSAQVTQLSAADVEQIYQFRDVIEQLAARLVAEKQPDLSDLDQALADMRSAAECNNVRAFYERDLAFHMLICEKSGNRFLEQALRRLLPPLFAFVVMRLHTAETVAQHWAKSLEQHRQIVEALRSGDSFFAERRVAGMIQKFYSVTNELLTRASAARTTGDSSVAASRTR
jgi:DNA-binding GntR family transcriptional regulator